MGDAARQGDPQELTDPQLAEALRRVRDVRTPEALLTLLIEVGWGILPGDPPVTSWPAYRACLPVLRAGLHALLDDEDLTRAMLSGKWPG